MTKVRITRPILEYRQEMAELVEQICRESTVNGVDRQRMNKFVSPRKEVLELCLPGLLTHPQVESLWAAICLTDGHLDGWIQINTSECYGVLDVYVVLHDEQGDLIESDFAIHEESMPNHWGYFASAPVQPGTTVVVRAMAMDQFGGIGVCTERVTV